MARMEAPIEKVNKSYFQKQKWRSLKANHTHELQYTELFEDEPQASSDNEHAYSDSVGRYNYMYAYKIFIKSKVDQPNQVDLLQSEKKE